MLYSTIHQMTKAEKRLFRFEMNKLKKSTAYSKLFDYLSTVDTYDRENIKAYVKKKEILNFNTNVNHLFNKLVTFLTNHRPFSLDSMARRKTKQTLDEALTVEQLGFSKRAHKMMKKALKMALKNQHYDLAGKCLIFLFLIEKSHVHLRLSHTDIIGTLPIELNIRKLTQLQGMTRELYILMIKAEELFASPDTKEEDWKIVIENTTLKNADWNTLYFLNKTRVSRINIRYNVWLLQYEEALQQLKKLLNFYRESEETLVFFQDFMADYDGYCEVLYKAKHPDLTKHALEFNQLIDTHENAMKTVMSEAKFKEILFIHQLMNRVIQQYNLLLLDSFTIQDADRWSSGPKMENITPWAYYRRQSLMLSAFMYLLLREYDKFQDCRNMILEYKEEIYNDAIMKWEVEVLDLIEIYENNTNIYFSNYLRNSIRKNKQKAAAHKTIIYMLQLFNKLKKTTSPKEVLETALPEITALESKARFHTLHFSTWVRWRCK